MLGTLKLLPHLTLKTIYDSHVTVSMLWTKKFISSKQLVNYSKQVSKGLAVAGTNPHLIPTSRGVVTIPFCHRKWAEGRTLPATRGGQELIGSPLRDHGASDHLEAFWAKGLGEKVPPTCVDILLPLHNLLSLSTLQAAFERNVGIQRGA